METAKKKANNYSAYSDFYKKVVKEIRLAETKKEQEQKKIILNDLETLLGGKSLVLDGNLCK